MNDSLTSYLVILGGVVLIGVLAHGAWTSRKAAARHPKRAEVEPTDGDSPPVAFSPTSIMSHEPTRPMIADAAALAASAVVPPPLKKTGPRLDALIDAIATLKPEGVLSGDNILMHMPPTRRAGSKPVLIEGLRMDLDEWEPPQAGALYKEVQVGVLLANRMGGVNEIEYSEFVQKMQSMADTLGASIEFPDMLDVVARAKELDAFASAHDAQLAMRLHARGSAWSIGYVHQQAARHGFIQGALPGRMVLPGSEEGAPPMLVLQYDAQAAFSEEPDQATLRELSLSFDVPQTSADQEPFKAWCAAGEALSLSMDGLMADDQGQPFNAAAFASIGNELAKLYESLASRDLAAGTPAARRLFS